MYIRINANAKNIRKRNDRCLKRAKRHWLAMTQSNQQNGILLLLSLILLKKICNMSTQLSRHGSQANNVNVHFECMISHIRFKIKMFMIL